LTSSTIIAPTLTTYPQFQKYLGDSDVPVLVVWGKNDVAVIQAGAEAYKKDAKDAEVHLLDAGHFALELHAKEVAEYILDSRSRKGLCYIRTQAMAEP
jgi:pimeloyl-ACP methyl ester carboxylesterase